MNYEKLVLSNGYVFYCKDVGEILSITDIIDESNFGIEDYTFRVICSKDNFDYFSFKSKKSASRNRNKLLKWIDEIKRIDAEDIAGGGKMIEQEWINEICETCNFRFHKICRYNPPKDTDRDLGYPHTAYPLVLVGKCYEMACSKWKKKNRKKCKWE